MRIKSVRVRHLLVCAMKLGCNDHPPLRWLLEIGATDVDYFKVTSLAELEPEISSALAYGPVLVHVGFGIGDGVASYADLDWAWFNAQLRRAGSPHVAIHLEVSTHNCRTRPTCATKAGTRRGAWWSTSLSRIAFCATTSSPRSCLKTWTTWAGT